MGLKDWALVFCDECEANFSVMENQYGEIALVCACPPPEGVNQLDGDAGDWVNDHGTRMQT